MNNKIKVLIGDDTAEYGVKIASQLRELGLMPTHAEEMEQFY